jgi:hypothetical protein
VDNIKKVLILIAILLTIFAPITTYAMEGGLSQNLDETEIYLEQNRLFLEIPFTTKKGLNITQQELNLGFKKKFSLGKMQFFYKPILLFENYSPSGVEIKIGKEVEFLGIPLEIEIGIRNPKWYKRSAFKLKPDISLELFDFTLDHLNEQTQERS